MAELSDELARRLMPVREVIHRAACPSRFGRGRTTAACPKSIDDVEHACDHSRGRGGGSPLLPQRGLREAGALTLRWSCRLFGA